ncbi:hypothetical protein K491DRAFT_685230 [Lophiostoma macrostomum CBS 122681]|uniref:Uncharacterized protein n=1 Tax=Lophiostoma macrostomum CBS 122681 TaxID=1314788 RepID=A0A6A6SJ97_9PLEO|nr:hypothetical protein K491DRAFT_685230 [Lophiostoma macrostomum CBS 122681]
MSNDSIGTTCTYDPVYTFDGSCRSLGPTFTNFGTTFRTFDAQFFTATLSGNDASKNYIMVGRNGAAFKNCVPGSGSCISPDGLQEFYSEDSCAPGHITHSTAIAAGTTTLYCCPEVAADRLLGTVLLLPMPVTSVSLPGYSDEGGGFKKYMMCQYRLEGFNIAQSLNLLPAINEPPTVTSNTGHFPIFYTVQAHLAVHDSASSSMTGSVASPGFTSTFAAPTAGSTSVEKAPSSGSSRRTTIGIALAISLGGTLVLAIFIILCIRKSKRQKRKISSIDVAFYDKSELPANERQGEKKVHELIANRTYELQGECLPAEAPEGVVRDEEPDKNVVK